MRAKFIYEKFTEDSDPVKDMGIGQLYVIREWLKQHSHRSRSLKNPQDYMWLCVEQGNFEFVKILIDIGMDIHYGDDAALHMAIYGDYPKIVELLLKSGANIHAGDDWAKQTMISFGSQMSKEISKLIKKYLNK
jgi:hypothetical protein